MLPWRVTGKKLFWSRDRLIKHEFDCVGLEGKPGCGYIRVMNTVCTFDHELPKYQRLLI